MNIFITGLLRESPYAYDKSAWVNLLIAFTKEISEEQRIEFIEYARAMPYKNYLRTVYWGVIRGHINYLHPQCQFCKSDRARSVHHKTYEHRGEEWKYLDDLEVICRECHSHRHGLATPEQIDKIYKRRLNAWHYPTEYPSGELRDITHKNVNQIEELLEHSRKR